MPLFVTQVTVTDEQVREGWAGKSAEVAESIKATLHELIGDDGGAYVPAVQVWIYPENN